MPETSPNKPSKPPVVDPQGLMVRDYLADRDAPCPVCGYNLRDLATGECPECGQAISLHLQPAGPMTRRIGLIVLVFLWLLATSGIQGWSIGKSIHDRATNSFFSVFSLTTSGSLSFSPQINQTIVQLQKDLVVMQGNIPAVTDTPDVIVADELIVNVPTAEDAADGLDAEDSEDSTIASFTLSSGNALDTSWSVQFPQGQVTQMFGNTSRYNWGAVSWQQWTQAGMWLALGLTALTGFILLLLMRRRREPSPGLIRAIPILAWSGFGVFCTMQLLSTVFGLL